MPATRNGVEFVADRYLLTLLCLLLLAGCMGDRAAVRSTSDTLGSGLRAPRPDDAAHVRLRQSFDRLPMSFEANEGQTDEQVKFLARGNRYRVFLTPTEAVFSLTNPVPPDSRADAPDGRMSDVARPIAPSDAVMRMKLVGANPPKLIKGLELLPGKSNYIRGNDSSRWRTNVPTYGTVQYTDIYPGIDLFYHGNQHQLEYDFVVAPGADPKVIRLDFEGVDHMRIDPTGDLVLQLAGREVRHNRPAIYQESGQGRHEISGGYVLEGQGEVGFKIATYNIEIPLVIDPVLVYSTYLTGIIPGHNRSTPHAAGIAVAVDSAGNAYVAGSTDSPDFPTMNPFQPSLHGDVDAFVTKFSPDGSLVYSTFLGGAVGDDRNCPPVCGASSAATDIEVDSAGNMYVAGGTKALDFPVTPNAYLVPDGLPNAFVTKLNPSGSALVYSTMVYSGCVSCSHIALDSEGRVWLTAGTERQDFPTVNPLQPAFGGGRFDAIVMQLNAEGTGLLYSTYLGGTGDDDGIGIAIDAVDNVHLVGRTSSVDFPTVNAAQPSFGGGNYGDCWVATLNPQGSALVYSTYLGGLENELDCHLAGDAAGNAYVAGGTPSADFPIRHALQSIKKGQSDVFLSKFDANGSFVYSTFLGGSDEDVAFAVAADAAGNAYITGLTVSTDFPTLHGLQEFGGPPGPFGGGDAFVTKVNASGTAGIYSTYLGGSAQDLGLAIATDSAGSAHVTGLTNSLDFPTKHESQSPPSDVGEYAFVSKIADTACGEEVTGLLDIHRSRFFSIPLTRFRFQWVIVRNRTASVIGGPLAFVMDDLQNAIFIGSHLRTECFSPGGDPLRIVQTGTDEVLSPNEFALAGLWFFKTRSEPIAYRPRVLSGIATE